MNQENNFLLSKSIKIKIYIFILFASLLAPIFSYRNRSIIERVQENPYYGDLAPLILSESENKKTIDILFLGNSRMLHAIDARLLEKYFTKKKNVPFRVISLAAPKLDLDIMFYLLNEFFNSHDIHYIIFENTVFAFPPGASSMYMQNAFNFSRIKHETLIDYLLYYFNNASGSLFRIWREWKPSTLKKEAYTHYLKEKYYFGGLPINFDGSKFELIDYSNLKLINSAYFTSTSKNIKINTNNSQNFFLQKILTLYKNQLTHFFSISLPTRKEILNEEDSIIVLAKNEKKEIMQNIQPDYKTFFTDTGIKNVNLIYRDPFHFNTNGRQIFTQRLIPYLEYLMDKKNEN